MNKGEILGLAEKLLPCPFCGGSDIETSVGLSEMHDGEINCNDCGGNVGNHPSLSEAIAAWNRRADTQAADEIARLREERRGLVEALKVADDAIKEMFRYYDGGETRGSYDGKPERAQLRKAGYATSAMIAALQHKEPQP